MKLILCLLSINSIFAFNDNYQTCPKGKYGENCEKDCNCANWSSSNICSKIEGRCLDCKFGHFGSNCDSICYPTCKTNLCCAIKSNDFQESNNKLTIKNSMLILEIKEKTLNISVDYNVGYPLSIFNKTLDNFTLDFPTKETYNYEYTKYNITGEKYENNTVKFINQNDFNKELPLSIILDANYEPKDININGVIGLGIYNSINQKLRELNNSIENIASFRKDEEDISILFGDLFEEEKKYVNKLSFCKACGKNNSTKKD